MSPASLVDPDALEALLSLSQGDDVDAPTLRAFLAGAHERMKQRFLTRTPATELVHLRAAVIDDVVQRAWRKFGLHTVPHALLAVGGYGRGELHPYSDVDICILLSREPTADEARGMESFLAFLWDIGLEIGHSVRTVADCVERAIGDITIMTNMMEARLIVGPVSEFDALCAALTRADIWPADDFFKAKAHEQEQRHQRHNDALNQLEPNVKESPGGLRDIQVISWVANRHFATYGLETLVGHGFLTAAEFETLERGRNYLWRIRCALHFLAGRREDRLLFEHQQRVAVVFGYSDDSVNRAVEQFMKTYYRTVRELSALNEMLLELFQEAILQRDRSARAAPLNRRFQIRNGYIEVAHDKVFLRTPPALLEVFLLLQKNPAIKGVRASTIRLIRESLHLIDDKLRRDIRARSLFMEILRQPRRIGHELQRMHRYGVLAAYLPVFAKVEGLMQFDLFHVYTVDEHSLFVLRNMRRFSYPITESDQPPLVRQIIEQIPKLELLYICGLFHDIGKGSGRDHSEVGAEAAAEFCALHGLSSFDTNLVTWLVKNHLIMSATAQRKDIYDPEVVKDFGELVGDIIHLDYLFLLTVADVRGTNPELWTSWKESLLSELYVATRRLLRSGAEHYQDRVARLSSIKNEALKELDFTRFRESTVAMLWDTLSEPYFMRHRPYEIAWHTEVILTADADDLPVIAIRNFEKRGSTAIFIYAQDMDYLFAIASAALDRLRLDVQDARIITSESGFTLDTFMVLEADTRKPVTDPARVHDIQSKLRTALRSKSLAASPRVPSHYARRLKHFSVPASVEFTPDFVHKRTVMEVIAADRPGFLSVIGSAMQNCGVRLHDARIATFGERVEDYFYLTDLENQPVDDESTQICLRTEILNTLRELDK
ncbi:MAG: [protein-PII] uridylyltransferase [Gammaproteobacteria bacterium]|nr:[protein-PII] uridylyltransferase [Gammaproteobacteria bacterium]MBI5617304.1 [protein-PII] uridylyltransferase [Gammaproteobacteria bacterium]